LPLLSIVAVTIVAVPALPVSVWPPLLLCQVMAVPAEVSAVAGAPRVTVQRGVVDVGQGDAAAGGRQVGRVGRAGAVGVRAGEAFSDTRRLAVPTTGASLVPVIVKVEVAAAGRAGRIPNGVLEHLGRGLTGAECFGGGPVRRDSCSCRRRSA
jgi:hypothetical protein